MRVGFTGTRLGMTKAQTLQLADYFLSCMGSINDVHHGDCLGADAEFHVISRPYAIVIHAHPCNIPKMRAYCDADIIHDPLPPLVRNDVIVAHSDILIAAPAQNNEIVRSGTWATIRRARKAGIEILQLSR